MRFFCYYSSESDYQILYLLFFCKYLDIMGLPLPSSTGRRLLNLSKLSSAERIASIYSDISGQFIIHVQINRLNILIFSTQRCNVLTNGMFATLFILYVLTVTEKPWGYMPWPHCKALAILRLLASDRLSSSLYLQCP